MSYRSSVFAYLIVFIVTCGISLPAAEISPRDWPWWRGPERNGTAHPDQNPPLHWSDLENIAWQTPIPGRGHGSPIVVGNRVLITAADHETLQQMVICLNRTDGTEIWREVIHEQGFPTNGNEKASLASTTPACDGVRVFVNFFNDGSVLTTALRLDSGDQLWQQKISDYVIHQGYASSPALYNNLVIVSADNKGGGAVSALNSDTGDIIWTRKRPVKPNYPSPVILKVAGRDQLLLTGCDLVTSLDPATGKELWETTGATTECVTSTVTDGTHVFTSGGYPDNHIAAVTADGSGNEVWRIPVRTYVPSMLVQNGVLYAVMDVGIATCRKAATGEEIWKARLGGTFSSSPVLVGNRIYVTNESGLTFVYSSSVDGFELLAKNQLGDDVYATPVICDSRIYARIARRVDGKRQEFLYCIAGTGK
ncbi:MAG: PQQ-binding-like beta-propeller repeat protein [Fuerstiella sp.]|nr:PQQ-binding-like beta-propeller repeat protein [Fuerstiella sp.]